MKRQQPTGKQTNQAKDSGAMTGRSDSPIRTCILVAIMMIAVAALVFATHSPALSAQARSFDDEEAITDNYLVQNPSWNSVYRFLTEVRRPSSMKGYYRPLTMISLMLDWAAGGRPDNLRPFHRTSLALHVLNSTLVILLVYQLFGQPWVAGFVGLLFGLHPLTVEPIVWVMERKTLLAAFFGFCCLNLYVRYTRKPRWRWYTGTWCMYVFALMSKPTSVPLSIVLLLLDYWPMRRLRWRSMWEKMPFFAIGGIFAIITVLCEGEAQELVLPGKHSLAQLPLRICYLIGFYLSKIALPMYLSSFYPLPEPLTLSNPIVVLSVLGTAALSAALLVSWRWTPALIVGWLIFFLAISPTLGLIGYSWVSASDKYVYLPSIGLLVVLGWLMGLCWGASPGVALLSLRRVGLVVVVLILASAESIVTRNQLTRWQDTETLFRYMLRLTPQAYRLHNHLGFMLAEKGNTEEAIHHYLQALQFRPSFSRALNNLGRALAKLGKTDEAIQHYKQALLHDPTLVEAHNNLGIALTEQGKYDEAFRHYLKAIQLKREYPKTYNNLGVLFTKQGKIAEAINSYRQALQIDPHFAAAYSNLGLIDLQQGRVAEAVQHYEQALRLQPDLPEALNNLAWAFAAYDIANAPDPTYAIMLAERACQQSDSKNPEHLDTLAACYAAANRFPDAIRTAQKAIELAESTGQTQLAEAIRQRLRLYATNKAYRESSP